ncbi:protein madd-4 isoform X4 [Lutzomyia longipalpis]|uniref:protein madd-4 isoform X4 n=1 Tax=Lutzomyia longipalpis TaxID=7200 RepID=UPI002484086A|nr:protein madd-4 isoform X4 [Lutzomyia longipalpis]
MSSKKNRIFLDSDSSILEENLRFVKNDLEEEINTIFGQPDANLLPQAGAQYKIVKPKAGLEKDGRQLPEMKMANKIILLLLSILLKHISASQHAFNASEISEVWPTETDSDTDSGQKRGRNQGWSTWSEWSMCSRSCDGGVAQQLRRCHSPQGCRGEPIRYKICNMQPCPETQDFRAHQCAAYDDVPYDGSLFKWTPHYDYTEPCALTCRGQPAHLPDEAVSGGSVENESGVDDEPSVIVQLSPRVQDGTRCRPGSLDMCIQGKCQRVGCDLRIGSNKKVDACGVCGGDGNSCSQPLYHWDTTAMSLCSATCGGGYKMARPTCRNRVTGVEVDESLCSAVTRPEPAVIHCNTHQCPPKWVTDEWGVCSKTCGGGVRDRLVICVEESSGVKNKVADEMCHSPKPNTQEICNVHDCPNWVASDWSGCSVSCGKGIQVRSVECMETSGGMSTQCDPNDKPIAIQTCTTGISCSKEHSEDGENEEMEDDMEGHHADEPYYLEPRTAALSSRHDSFTSHESEYHNDRLAGDQRSPSEATFVKDNDWGPCSVTCGEGTRKKQYRCKIYLEFSRTMATLNDSLCSGPKPPDQVERCYLEPCSTFYGYDQSYSRDSKAQAPVPGKTYSWREQGYSPCTATCLGGVEELIINCVRDDTGKVASPFLCPQDTKPETRSRPCNDHQCPPRWNYSEYSACSKSCGIGIRTREVQCIHEVARGPENIMIVPNNMCPQPPPSDRQYCNVLDCPVRWEVSEWSKCSRPCGGGIKERRVECKQIMAQEHKVERPVSMCPSAKPPDRKSCNTKACAPEDQRPQIAVSNSTYIQHDVKRQKVTLKVGGAATVFFGTQIKIKCPVKSRFNRTRIRWSKDNVFLTKSRKFKISQKGALRIVHISYRDSGIYTCHASLSSADLKLTVKPKPGDFPSQEQYEKYREDIELKALRTHSNPDTQESTFLGSSEARSRDPSSRGKSRDSHRGESRHKFSSAGVMGEDHEDDESQLLWPFQSFSHSKGHDMLIRNGQYFPELDIGADTPQPQALIQPNTNFQHHLNTIQNAAGEEVLSDEAPLHHITAAEFFGDVTNSSEAIVLGHGSPTNLKFEWTYSSWTDCSQSCGNGFGIKTRTVQCMVLLGNASQNVDSALCEDAGLRMPESVQKCGAIDCPKWVAGEWNPCNASKCFSWHTAIQRRRVTCEISGIKTSTSKCVTAERPVSKQECYNEECYGVWKVDPWSQCNALCGRQGLKYRILRCVWRGTKRPAGDACKDQPRPMVMKICRAPPCIPNNPDCRDISRHCKNARGMGLCRLHRFQQQCCKSCSFNIFH